MPFVASTLALALSAAVSTPDLAPRTVEADGRGSATAPLTGLENSVLTGFSLRFREGDHEVRQIEINHRADEALGMLADQSADDEMTMRISYAGVAHRREYQTGGKCRGTCSLPIARPPSEIEGTKRLVLVNFRVTVASTTDRDRRIRVLSIRPSADERTFRVEVRDNTSFDYWVSIDYAWIAGRRSGKLTDSATRSANERTQALKIGSPTNALRTFIAGFSVEFTNGEHNLRDLAFEPDAEGQYRVRFNDNNYDDPMTATLDRVWMNP